MDETAQLQGGYLNMQWFYNLKIGTKLIISFIVVALIAGLVGLIGVINMQKLDNDYSDLLKNSGMPLADIGSAGMYFQRIRVNMKDIVLDDNDSYKQDSIDKINKYDRKIETELAVFEKSIKTDKVRTEFMKLKDLLAQYNEDRVRAIQLAKSGKYAEAQALMRGRMLNEGTKIDELINRILGDKIANGTKCSNDLSNLANRTLTIMIIIVLVAMGVAFGLGLFLANIISKPIKFLDEAALKLALGDVNVDVKSTTKDEIGNLMDAFAGMIDNIRDQAKAVEKIAEGDLTIDVKVKSDHDLLGKKLAEMVKTNNEVLGTINVSAEQVAAGSRQVSVSSQALSQGSSEQASSIEEITASITEIATQTKQNAVNASEANELANDAKTNAVQGNEQMKEMLKAMAEINDSSDNISKIIKVIDEIAFQTNILALNAAVEAARAGQHGKGFAVVAEEVRNLAARSANAAKETTTLIEGSIKKVEAGTKIANETAVALNQIVEGITKAATLVGDIAVASNSQATGITQITQGIEQVSQVTQSNTATAEESASASEELSSQAEMLKTMVANFKLKNIGQSFDKLKGINPELLRAIEDMVEKKNDQPDMVSASKNSPQKRTVKINLDDNEFGKY
jgi:methyl-accepting chemotaxis protein